MIYAGSVLIAELTDVLAGEPGVVLAVLIGSRARGDADEHEDVDLLLELDPPGDEVMLALRERLVAVAGADVDPRTTRSAAYSRHFWNKAVGEGRPLVDRKQRWPSIKADPEAARRGARRPGRGPIERRARDGEVDAGAGVGGRHGRGPAGTGRRIGLLTGRRAAAAGTLCFGRGWSPTGSGLRRRGTAQCGFDSFEPTVELTELLRGRRLGTLGLLLTA